MNEMTWTELVDSVKFRRKLESHLMDELIKILDVPADRNTCFPGYLAKRSNRHNMFQFIGVIGEGVSGSLYILPNKPIVSFYVCSSNEKRHAEDVDMHDPSFPNSLYAAIKESIYKVTGEKLM